MLLSCPIAIPKDFLNNAHTAILSLCLLMTVGRTDFRHGQLGRTLN